MRFYNKEKWLFNDNIKKKVRNINAYLTEGENILVERKAKPMFDLPEMSFGDMPNDGNSLVVELSEFLEFQDSGADKFLKKYVGAKEFINGTYRYCIWLPYKVKNKIVEDALDIPLIRERVEMCRRHRVDSKDSSANKLAKFPWKFRDIKVAKQNVILIPNVSSENRMYAPMGIVGSDTIVTNASCIYDAPIWILGLLESRIHMVWLRAVGGRLKTDYRYSAGLVYNTFPVPELSTRRKNEIEDLVLKILDIRDEEGGTLAELYGSPLAEKNPKPMNPRLLKAHQELDAVVDRAYKSGGFKDDSERLSLLLKMYSEKIAQQKK